MNSGMDQEKIIRYREKTFRMHPEDRLTTGAEAIEFVNERGFILFHPAKDVVLPSLWVATAGDRPVPNEHDDPGHQSWAWKDEYLDKKVWFYIRLLHRNMSIISLDFMADFYALSPNYGDYHNDYLLQYKEGTFSYECKSIYEALLEEGPLNTLELREKAHLWGSQNQYRYTKSLNQLQQELKVMPVGIAAAGHWNYAFIFDIVPRVFADVEQQARNIRQKDARLRILRQYFQSVGSATMQGLSKIFLWDRKVLMRELDVLTVENFVQCIQPENAPNLRIYGLPELLI